MNWKKILPLIGIIILIGLLYKIGFMKIISSISTINPIYLLLIPVFIISGLFIQTWKWFLILKKQKIRIKFETAFRIHMIGYFYAMLTPAKLGYLLKIFYLKNETGKSTGECASGVIIDRFLDMMVLALFALAGALVIINTSTNALIQVSFTLLLFVTGGIFLFSKKVNHFTLKTAYNFIMPEKIKKQTKQSYQDFYKNLPEVTSLIMPFLLTLINWLLIVTQTYIIVLAFSLAISYFEFLFLFPLATIAGLLPITISGLGTREITLIALFPNVPAESLVAMSLVALILYSYAPALLGWIYSFKKDEYKEIHKI